MKLKNYFDKIKYGLLIGLASISINAQPVVAQPNDYEKSKLEASIVSEDSSGKDKLEEKLNEDTFMSMSLLTDFNTYKFDGGESIRVKIIDIGIDMSYIHNNGKNGILLGLSALKRINVDKKTLIIPYFMAQGSTAKSGKGVTDAQSKLEDFGNISFGLKMGRKISNKPQPYGIGIDIRQINYLDKSKGKDFVAGIFMYANPQH